ncbi:hypothetical protein N7E81_01215 [Reichenbachiella carrageenanivorans]|uniref:Lipoprotein n=1 Tax=Reichenbachiella carrageenanivorans TaxID=2979869 RepID=A0ABY6D7B7_9BACT|nr:hypothetical protein [Reichenbachiella carrageenanivorans]UXX79730.1 hypothetical protein N7E81_01215 [Reichenbachiella carrageenanivorans]
MKKLLALLFVFTTMGLMVSCDDDDKDDPAVPAKTTEELQTEAVETTQAAVDAKASSDDSATGATDETVFDDWTLMDNADQTASRVAVDAAPEVEVDANISTDTDWTKDNVYVLKTRVTVVDGATLTIEAGTVIKGDASLSGAKAAVLMVARGAKLIAEGTATEPIIMTSTDDDIEPGQFKGTTLNQDSKGKWGGLVILGKAPVSAKTENPQIEGVDASDTNGQYGGDDAADNSGSIKYVSIRHGGAEIAEGSEINGLTLGGVGTGTTIENIEVYGNEDDGVEFFGGTVNVTNLLVYAVGDDGIDIDQSYAGEVKNFAVYTDKNSDKCLEIDGREGALDKSFTLTNGTIHAVGSDAKMEADFKSKAKGTLTNVDMTGYKVKLSASYDTEEYVEGEAYTETEDAAKNVADGSLVFTKVKASEFVVYTGSFDEE